MENKIKISSIEVKYLGDVNKSNTVLPSECCDSLGKFKLPHGILNKGVTGCGGTTLALQDNNNTVILSPRVKLIENKGNQHADALVWYSGVRECKNMGRECKKLEEYLDWCDKNGKRYKILTTYDSFIKMSAELPREDRINNTNEPNTLKFPCDWHIVVDEFQQLLLDCMFKAETERDLLECLSTFDYVTYMSATPAEPLYNDKLSDVFAPFGLNKLPVYTLHWEHHSKTIVNIKDLKNEMSPVRAMHRVIEDLKDAYAGKTPFEKRVNSKGNIVECKEAVFFVNSVEVIINTIHKLDLKPEECTIIVADNPENKEMIKQLNCSLYAKTNPAKRLKSTEYKQCNHIPTAGEVHKPFTFCTSTAYMGVDFYSTNARTYVISDDAHTVCSTNIALELTQIAGRQRLRDVNLFANELTLIHNSATKYDIKRMKGEIKAKAKFAMEQFNDYKSQFDCLKRGNLDTGRLTRGLERDLNLFRSAGWASFIIKKGSNYEFNAYAKEALEYRVEALNTILQNGIDTVINNTALLAVGTHSNIRTKANTPDNDNAIFRVSFARVLEDLCKRYDHRKNINAKRNSRIKIGIKPDELYDNLTPKINQAWALLEAVKYDTDAVRKCNYDATKIRMHITLSDKENQQNFNAYINSKLLNKTFDSRNAIKRILQSMYNRIGETNHKAKATDIEDFGFKIVQTSTKVAGVKTNIFKVEKV